MDATTNAANPVTANLSIDELMAEIAARSGKSVKLVEVKAKPEKPAPVVVTPEDHLLNAFKRLVKTEIVWVDGTEGAEGHNEVKLSVIPAEARAEGTDEAVYFEALSVKARTTEEKIAASKRPAYTGAKRGPKAKTENAAPTDAGAAAPEGTDNAPAAAPEGN